AFTTLQSRLFFPIGSMLSVSVEIQGSLALFERIFDYLRMPHDIVDTDNPVPVDSTEVRGDVRLDHVYFRYDPAAYGPFAEAEPEARHAGNGAQPARRIWALEDV